MTTKQYEPNPEKHDPQFGEHPYRYMELQTVCYIDNCDHKEDVMQCPKCEIYLCDCCAESDKTEEVEAYYGCDAKCPKCNYWARTKDGPRWIDTYNRW